MRKEEWGLTAVGSLLLSFAFPPYFISILAISALGGLGYLLKTLNPEDRKKLIAFEKEFRKGYALEQKGQLDKATEHYNTLIKEYSKFTDIVKSRIDLIQEKKGKKNKVNDQGKKN